MIARTPSLSVALPKNSIVSAAKTSSGGAYSSSIPYDLLLAPSTTANILDHSPYLFSALFVLQEYNNILNDRCQITSRPEFTRISVVKYSLFCPLLEDVCWENELPTLGKSSNPFFFKPLINKARTLFSKKRSKCPRGIKIAEKEGKLLLYRGRVGHFSIKNSSKIS